MGRIHQTTGTIRVPQQSAQARQELKEKLEAWKKKAWFDFCKLLMEEDKRYTLMPIMDYNARSGRQGMDARIQNADGVFSNFCLTRTGDRVDVFITPCDPMLGINIDAGSKYSKLSVQGFPSKAMVWPILRIADELERQYVREVMVESNKRTKGRTNAKYSSSSNSDSNADQLSADCQADRP